MRGVRSPPFAYEMDEVDERLAVSHQGRHRYPLFGAMVSGSFRTELDTGHAGLQPGRDVGGAVAAHRDPLAGAARARSLGEHRHIRVGARHDYGVAPEDRVDARVRDRLDL